jgi:predicted dehydrogenase
MVDLARMLFGEVQSAQSVSRTNLDRGPAGEDHDLVFCLRFSHGLIAMFHTLDFHHYRENSLDIWGTHGRLAIVQEGLATLYHARQDHRALEGAREVASDSGTALVCTAGEALYCLYDNLAGHLSSASEPLWSDAANALRSEGVIEALLESADVPGRLTEPQPRLIA